MCLLQPPELIGINQVYALKLGEYKVLQPYIIIKSFIASVLKYLSYLGTYFSIHFFQLKIHEN